MFCQIILLKRSSLLFGGLVAHEACTDPGSQLESASGQFENWWSSMGDVLQIFGVE